MPSRKTDYKVIYSLRLHIALQELGFMCLTEMKNPQKPRLNCWVYEMTPEFQKALDSLLEGGSDNG